MLYNGGGVLLNKGMSHGNFIFLIFLLSLWLLSYTLIINRTEKGFLRYLLIWTVGRVLGTFKTKSLLLFFVFFELRVIPITLIVFIFGYQPEKLQASFSLLLYTVTRSMPLLLFILIGELSLLTSAVLTFPVTISFMVKTPMYLVHIWLPKAHVEAPVGGSILLAGVLLKLGSYGLLVFLPNVKLNMLLTWYFAISLIGSTVCSLICLRQGDFKLLVAYSSVVHMRVVTLGYLRGREIGYRCGLIIVLRHGLCSPHLFAFGHWYYQSSHSRLILNNNCTLPIMISGLIALASLNMGVPPSLSVWAEVLITIRLLHFIVLVFPLLIFILFLSAAYNLYMYVSCRHCKRIENDRTLNNASFYSLLQVLFLGYCSFVCLDLFHPSFFYPI